MTVMALYKRTILYPGAINWFHDLFIAVWNESNIWQANNEWQLDNVST